MNKIVIAGGSGFLGGVLARYLIDRGASVVILTRRPKNMPGPIAEECWDGKTLGPWTAQLEGARAVINLSGRSVNCRYHARNRRILLESRTESTRVLGEGIARCHTPPPVWLNASTATIYRHTFERAHDETGEIGSHPNAKDAFSIHVAQAWERALAEAVTPRTRKVALRAAMVLGMGGNSVFPVLRRLARLGLGGKMASGQQYVSWIHQEDFCRAVEHVIVNETLSGPVNLAAPCPLPNADMMAELRRLCRMPAGLPAPLWMLETGAFFLRTETELIIKSRRVVPERLLQSGFRFRFETIREAFADLMPARA